MTSAGPGQNCETLRWNGLTFVSDHALQIGFCTSIEFFTNSSHYIVASHHGQGVCRAGDFTTSTCIGRMERASASCSAICGFDPCHNSNLGIAKRLSGCCCGSCLLSMTCAKAPSLACRSLSLIVTGKIILRIFDCVQAPSHSTNCTQNHPWNGSGCSFAPFSLVPLSGLCGLSRKKPTHEQRVWCSRPPQPLEELLLQGQEKARQRRLEKAMTPRATG